MKKIALLFGIALSLGMMSCDDMLPNPEPGHNPELDLFASGDLAIEKVGGDDAVLDLPALADAGERAVLAKITKLENFPSTYNLVFHVEFSNTPDFAKKGEFTAQLDGDNIVAGPATITTAINEYITRDPAQIKLYTRFAAYAVQGSSSLRLGGADFSYGDYDYTVDQLPPSVILSKDYYIFSREIGATEWVSAPCSKSDNNSSVYDNGVFTALIDVTSAGAEWAIGSTPAAPDYSIVPKSAGATNGTIERATDVTPGIITAMSPYLVTFDVVNNTYNYSLAFDCLYVPGGATGLNNFDAALKLFPNNTFTVYSGTMRLYNQFYFTGQPADNGVVFMRDGDVSVDDKGIITGKVLAEENVTDKTFSASNGLYYIEVNLTDNKVKIVPVKTIQIIGQLNGWNLETAAELTASSRNRIWTIKGVELKANEEFKFCVDHSWDYSFGGSFTDLVQNGGNLKVGEDGTYDLTLDFTTQPNTVTYVKK